MFVKNTDAVDTKNTLVVVRGERWAKWMKGSKGS